MNTEASPHYEKGFYVDWEQIHRDCRALAWRLEQCIDPDHPLRGILSITRGGMVPAMIVARELDIRAIDTISIKCYDHQDRGEPVIIKPGNDEFLVDGADILVIDDLVDTGATMKRVREFYPEATYCSVYAKPDGRPLVDVFVTEVSQDTWIFFPWDMSLQYAKPFRAS
ncbi:MAG: xanthine phosphoribosyltransferase [Rhodobacteraceae bacterium]|nr:xanthine phosphoribosyltransferase [Paracoccaceae bacterium]